MYLINFPNIPTFPKNIKYAHKTLKEAKREIDKVIDLVTVKNSKTGSQYICKSALKTVKYISYHFICMHKDHPFFKQLYHGPNGIQTGSE